MAEIIHIYSSPEEIDEIVKEAIQSLDRALELFMMIEKEDKLSEILADETYKVLNLAENLLHGKNLND